MEDELTNTMLALKSDILPVKRFVVSGWWFFNSACTGNNNPVYMFMRHLSSLL
jgi:hypothetical protein